MIVYKFGGTSVGTPERMHEVARLITADDNPKIVVLSAVSGTTNTLVLIGEYLLAGDHGAAREHIMKLEKSYKQFVEQLYTTSKGQQQGEGILLGSFKNIYALAETPGFNHGNYNTLLSYGEILSTQLFSAYMEEIAVEAVLLSAFDFMRLDEDDEPDMAYLSEKLGGLVQKEAASLFITQGFICRNAQGEIDNLKRGGSDYTASLLGAALQVEEVQIWTDIDGMHNNDPRIVENTFPIAKLSFDEAAELAYFGAKILHPSSILPAQKHNVPVRLKNTMQPQAAGTLIGARAQGADVKAIAAKDGITAIKIKSTRMLLAHGFLRRIFEVFEKYKTSIDMITTSEVAVSVTIDDATHLVAIMEELESFGTVAKDIDQAIICIVGNMISEKKGILNKIFDAISDIPVRMVSYGGSKNNISLLVDASYKAQALKQLNNGLFERRG